MRHILATCLLLVIALPCQAQGDKPKPNTLTPKEIADGWILLFDGETTFGWAHKTRETFSVVDNALHLHDTRIKFQSPFGEFELTFEYLLHSGIARMTI